MTFQTALLLLGGTVAWTLIYLGHCWVYPYKVCGLCKGERRVTSKSFKGAFADCWRCNATGRKLRAGARFLGRGEEPA